jgi:acetylglutamate kinase
MQPLSPSLAPLTVIKIGGTLLEHTQVIESLWRQVAALHDRGDQVVIVHGGGRQATELAARLGHRPRMVHGRRVTTDLDLEIVLWTFRGSLNSRLVAAAHRNGVPAAGISGVDGGTLNVHRRPPREIDGDEVDFGWVGDVDGVEPYLLRALLAGGVVPVVAPLGVDDAGVIYNVNADTVAVAIAEGLQASSLLFAAESAGLRRDAADPETHITECDQDLLDRGLREGWITDGMKVKLETALQAAQVVPSVAIVPPDALMNPTRGTWIRAGTR